MPVYDYCIGGKMKYEIIKGSEKDFNGAPEWATKLLGETSVSRQAFAGYLSGLMIGAYKENPRYWWKVNERNTATIIAERRPITEPVFAVDCLPPVGSRIEYACIKPDNGHPAIEFGKWYGGTVIAYYEGFVWTSDNGIRRLDNTIFRPMKSPEDVARDEAKAAIAELCRSSASNGHSADLIYDAIAAGKIQGITKNPTVSELMHVTEKATREDCEAIVKLFSGK